MPCAAANPGDLELLVQFPDLLSHSLYLRRQEHCVSHGLLPWRGRSLPLGFPLGLLALHQHSRGSCPALPLTGWHLQPKTSVGVVSIPPGAHAARSAGFGSVRCVYCFNTSTPGTILGEVFYKHMDDTVPAPKSFQTQGKLMDDGWI